MYNFEKFKNNLNINLYTINFEDINTMHRQYKNNIRRYCNTNIIKNSYSLGVTQSLM